MAVPTPYRVQSSCFTFTNHYIFKLPTTTHGEASYLQPLLMLRVLLMQRVAPQRPRCDDLLDL